MNIPRCNISLNNMDCMEAFKDMPDNYFDLAIVDPPYGIGNWVPNNVAKNSKNKSEIKLLKPKFKEVTWNESPPELNYFDEVNRVSKRQIIWGANYYNCFSDGGSALVWYKAMGNPQFSQCEIASLSWGKKVDYVRIDWQSGFAREQKEKVIHPCQKPVALYKWLLQNYAKEGDKILDTHLGSGSIAIACWDMKFDLVGYELDEDYYKAACSRLKTHQSQGQLF